MRKTTPDAPLSITARVPLSPEPFEWVQIRVDDRPFTYWLDTKQDVTRMEQELQRYIGIENARKLVTSLWLARQGATR